jgi:hypothetical protein
VDLRPSEETPQESVFYFDGSPMLTKYAASPRSWRTSNPGLFGFNVLAMNHGAFAHVLGVAVFQSPEQGHQVFVIYLDVVQVP